MRLFVYVYINLILLSFSNLNCQNENHLNVYVHQYSALNKNNNIKKQFEKLNNCTLNCMSFDSSAALLSRIFLEGSKTKADIIIGIDANHIAKLKKINSFLDHNIKNVNLPITWKDKKFIPYSYAYLSFIFNKKLIDKYPKSMDELVNNNNYKIIIPDPRTSTLGLNFTLWIKKIYKDQSSHVWKKLKPKILTFTKGWGEAYGMFMKEEAPIVLSHSTSPAFHTYKKQNNFFSVNFPEGHYLQIRTAAILKSSANYELAYKFLDFITSKEYQKYIPHTNWIYPVIKLSNTPPSGFPTIEPKPLYFSSEYIHKNSPAIIHEWLNVMIK